MDTGLFILNRYIQPQLELEQQRRQIHNNESLLSTRERWFFDDYRMLKLLLPPNNGCQAKNNLYVDYNLSDEIMKFWATGRACLVSKKYNNDEKHQYPLFAYALSEYFLKDEIRIERKLAVSNSGQEIKPPTASRSSILREIDQKSLISGKLISCDSIYFFI
jgi:hypothetical protein